MDHPFHHENRADYDWVELARRIAREAGADCPEKETEAVRLWVKAFADYRMDPYGVEYPARSDGHADHAGGRLR